MNGEVAAACSTRTLLQPRVRGIGSSSDAAIADLADCQHGVVTRTQLLDVGLGPDAIGRRLRAGRLHRLHRGVYAVGHRVISREGRWMAAVLSCGIGAVLSHRSAAALWGVRPWNGPIEVTTPAKSRSRGDVHRHSAVLPGDEVTERDGIPVTTAPRTLFDLAAIVPLDILERALRESEYLRLYDKLSLPTLLARYPRQRGTRNVRACLGRRAELPDGRTRSPLEERFLPFLERHCLPRPQLNAWVEAGEHTFQVDCLWPRQRLLVELDSFEAHGIRPVFESDRTRDRALQVAGYRPARITWRQLDEEPEVVAADLRALLAAPAT